MRTVVIHDWLTTHAGSERVLAAMLAAYPDAELRALVHEPESFAGTVLANRAVGTSFIQRLPRATKKYRSYLPLMPLAVEQFDVSDFDLVISNVNALCHGVLSSHEQLHVAYVNRSMRYAWDQYHAELRGFGVDRGLKGVFARTTLHYVRLWDYQAMQRPDVVVANSRYLASVIRKTYRRDAEVIYPPVAVDEFTMTGEKDDYFIAISRLVPWKRIDVIVDAFNDLGLPLKIVGEGPLQNRLSRSARTNVELLGAVPRSQTVALLQRARALVVAADEPFGIVPVEAQAAGTPVLGYRGGGITETIVDGETGMLFAAQRPNSLAEAVRAFTTRERQFEPEALRRNAEQFAEERFRREFTELVERSFAAVEARRAASSGAGGAPLAREPGGDPSHGPQVGGHREER